jgi:ABC-type Co2+ transport system permease subunit
MPSDRIPAYRLSRREKWMLGGVLGVVAALAVVLVISFVSSGPSSGHGCIYANIPGAVGAEQVHECGATARQTCRSVNAPGAYTRQAAHTLATECRKAGLPVGPHS